MAEQYLPDTFGAMTGAFNAGRLIRAQRQQAQQQQQLSALAPAVLNGDPGATAQAYALDPATAKQYGEGAERIGLQLHNIANQIKQMHAAGNEQGAAMLYSQAAPMIRQKFPNAPAQWDANALMPAIDAVVAMTAPGDTQQRNLAVSPGSAIVDPQTGKVIYERPFAPANTPLVDVPDGQGGTIKMAYDPKTQQLSMPQYPGQGAAPQGQPQMAPGEVPFSIDPTLPPEVQAAIRANPQAGSAEGITEPVTGIPQGGAPQAPRMGYTPPKSELTHTRTLSPQEVVARGYRPGTIVQVDGLGKEQVTQTPPAEAAGGRLSATALRQVNAAKAKLIDLQAVKNQLALVQQKFQPLQNSFSAGPFGGGLLPTEDGKRYDAAVSLLQQFVRKLTRTPGEGSMSDWEGKLAMLANPSRNDYESVTQDKIDQLNSLVEQITQGYQALLQDNQGEAMPQQGAQPSQAPRGVQQAGWSIQAVP